MLLLFLDGMQKHIPITKKEIEVSIGLSREWDAKAAGREVAQAAIKKLKTPPSFLLLFSTIHYKKHGGFKQFLEGVWEVLPKNTPLVGGTITGFITNDGCFARGAAALALSYVNIDVVLAQGSHTKRKPKSAAKNCADQINYGLKGSKFKNKFLFNIISGPTVANLPYLGKINVIKSNFFGGMAAKLGVRFFSLIEYGWGKEEEIIENIGTRLPDYYIFGGSAVDSGEISENYQFLDRMVLKNSIVSLGCSIDLPIFLKTNLSVHETDKIFEVTDTKRNERIIKNLDNKPAKQQILDVFGVKYDQLEDLKAFYYKISNYFPVASKEDKRLTSGIAGFFGDNVFLGYKLKGKSIRLLTTTGKEALSVVDKTFKNLDVKKFPFLFMSYSSILVSFLGNQVYTLKERIDEYVDGTPYLIICPINENSGNPNETAVSHVYSFNVMSIDVDNLNKMIFN